MALSQKKAPSLLYLAAEVSAKELSVALGDCVNPAGTIEFSGSGEGRKSEEFLSIVQQLARQAASGPQSLGLLLIGSGPGSFTGLRIGFSAMKGLAYTLKIPLIARSSFQAMAYEFRNEARLLCPMAAAGRGEYFAAVYQVEGQGLREVLPVQILERDALLRRLQEQKAALKIGCDEVLLLSEEPLSAFDARSLSPRHRARSLAEEYFSSVAEPAREPLSAVELAALTPLYLRAVNAKTIAERQAEKRAAARLDQSPAAIRIDTGR